MYYLSYCKVSPHVHPHQTEYYIILKGELKAYHNGKWKTLKKGDELTITPGEVHTFDKGATDEVVFFNSFHPALSFEGYFDKLHTLAHSGKVKNLTGRQSCIQGRRMKS